MGHFYVYRQGNHLHYQDIQAF